MGGSNNFDQIVQELSEQQHLTICQKIIHADGSEALLEHHNKFNSKKIQHLITRVSS